MPNAFNIHVTRIYNGYCYPCYAVRRRCKDDCLVIYCNVMRINLLGCLLPYTYVQYSWLTLLLHVIDRFIHEFLYLLMYSSFFWLSMCSLCNLVHLLPDFVHISLWFTHLDLLLINFLDINIIENFGSRAPIPKGYETSVENLFVCKAMWCTFYG